MGIKIFALVGIVVAILFAAGGDSLTDPAMDRNYPGTGTGTLDIRADVDAFDVAGGFVTQFSVQVRDGIGDPITGAAVTITNPGFGEVTLLDPEGSGNYLAERNAFHEGDFALSVVSGTEVVEGVVLGGPRNPHDFHARRGLGPRRGPGHDGALERSLASQERGGRDEGLT